MGKVCLLIVFCACTSLMLYSCKQGCTNQHAVNYMPKANSEDGSCLYCDTSGGLLMSYKYTALYDYKPGSFFYSELVAVFTDSITLTTFSGNGCMASGLQESDSCFTLRHHIHFYNQKNIPMLVSANIRVGYTGIADLKTYTLTDLYVPAAGEASPQWSIGVCAPTTNVSVSLSNINFSYP